MGVSKLLVVLIVAAAVTAVAGRPSVEPALTTTGANAALHTLDAELEAAEDALNAAVDEQEADSESVAGDSARFAEVSAESRAQAKAALKSISGLASAAVEKAQQMLATVAHNQQMLDEEAVTEFNEKANDALSAALDALHDSNAKLNSLSGVEANAHAISGDANAAAAPVSAPLPPPIPSASVDASDSVDSESDEMVAPNAAVVTAEQEQAPSHLMDASPTLRLAEVDRRRGGGRRGRGRGRAPSPGSPKPPAQGRSKRRGGKNRRNKALKKRSGKNRRNKALKKRSGKNRRNKALKKRNGKNRRNKALKKRSGKNRRNKALKKRNGKNRRIRNRQNRKDKRAAKRAAKRAKRCRKCRAGAAGDKCRARNCSPLPGAAGAAAATADAASGPVATPSSTDAATAPTAAAASGPIATLSAEAATTAGSGGVAPAPAVAGEAATLSGSSDASLSSSVGRVGRRACLRRCGTARTVAGKDCRQGCRGKIVCAQGAEGVQCRRRRRQLRKLRRQRKNNRNARRIAAASPLAAAGPAPQLPGVAAATATAPAARVTNVAEASAQIQRLLVAQRETNAELAAAKALLKRNRRKVQVLAERQWDDKNWWRSSKQAMPPLLPTRGRPLPPAKQNVKPPRMGADVSPAKAAEQLSASPVPAPPGPGAAKKPLTRRERKEARKQRKRERRERRRNRGFFGRFAEEEEAEAAPVSATGKQLFAPKMVDGYTVAASRLHLDESDETEYTSFIGLEENVEPTGTNAPAPKKKLFEAKYAPAYKPAAVNGVSTAQSYVKVEIGDPFPAKTAAKAAKAAQDLAAGKAPEPQRIFKSSYLSPLPVPSTKVRCYGKPGSKHEKCYRVDQKTGTVLGRPTPGSPFVLQFNKNGKAVETPSGHVMEKKGFREPEYDVKLALWKPRKHKRTLVPATTVSL